VHDYRTGRRAAKFTLLVAAGAGATGGGVAAAIAARRTVALIGSDADRMIGAPRRRST